MHLKKFEDAGINDRFIGQVFGINLHEARALACTEQAFRQRTLQQQTDPVANIGANLVAGNIGKAELVTQQVDGPGQIGDRVDQGAVQVEKKGVNGHNENRRLVAQGQR